MNNAETPMLQAVIVEAELQFSLPELSRACGVDVTLLESLVHEGALTPQGDSPAQWRFEGTVLHRARRAIRLSRELELSAASTALVLELLDEIASLKARVRLSGG